MKRDSLQYQIRSVTDGKRGTWLLLFPTLLKMTTQDLQMVLDWPTQKFTNKVERFMWLVNYHQMFIKDYGKREISLYQRTGRQTFHWDADQESAFSDLKAA
ncbi:MAG: hypothetical protein ABW185_07155 [Sedimenticola sp.]